MKLYHGSKRVIVLLKPEEYKKVKAEAGLVPISTWIRNMLLNPSLAGVSARYEAQIPELIDVSKIDLEKPLYSEGAKKVIRKAVIGCKTHGLAFCKACKPS